MNDQVHKRPLASGEAPVAIVTHRWRPLGGRQKELILLVLNNRPSEIEVDNLKLRTRPNGAPTMVKQLKFEAVEWHVTAQVGRVKALDP
jgi:hypothetical protein